MTHGVARYSLKQDWMRGLPLIKWPDIPISVFDENTHFGFGS